MASIFVGHPFDTVKVRFQNPTTSGRYHSTLHAITTIAREERVLGLFKGISSPLASAPFLNGLVFATYRFLMKLQLRAEGQVPSITQIFLAGAGCGMIASTITTPIELIKIQQQQSLLPIRRHGTSATTNAAAAPSARDIAVRIFKEYGVRGLYRGITATALRDIGYGAYFASYEASIRLMAPRQTSDQVSPSPSLSWVSFLFAGGIAGIMGWLATFPFDVIKTRIQSSFDGSIAPPSLPSHTILPSSSSTSLSPNSSSPLLRDLQERPYRNTISTIVYSYRTEGAGVFFRGLAPTLIRAIPVNMVVFATFEAVVHACS
ncbi:carnitine/acyl carnitine carrier [Amylostereum chailletii]|nr:carnitine/acyl carnitine carrier [Amylostereum chailletii]